MLREQGKCKEQFAWLDMGGQKERAEGSLHGQTCEGKRRGGEGSLHGHTYKGKRRAEGRGQLVQLEMGGEGKGWAHLSAMRAAARDEGQ